MPRLLHGPLYFIKKVAAWLFAHLQNLCLNFCMGPSILFQKSWHGYLPIFRVFALASKFVHLLYKENRGLDICPPTWAHLLYQTKVVAWTLAELIYIINNRRFLLLTASIYFVHLLRRHAELIYIINNPQFVWWVLSTFDKPTLSSVSHTTSSNVDASTLSESTF